MKTGIPTDDEYIRQVIVQHPKIDLIFDGIKDTDNTVLFCARYQGILLYIDDIRIPENSASTTNRRTMPYTDVYTKGSWNIVRSYDKFVEFLETFGIPDVISFDHDLSDVDDEEDTIEQYGSVFGVNKKITTKKPAPTNRRREMTGVDCIQYLLNECKYAKKPVCDYIIHSSNPVGCTNMENLLNDYVKKYGKKEFFKYA